jgi:hypothetical protein
MKGIRKVVENWIVPLCVYGVVSMAVVRLVAVDLYRLMLYFVDSRVVGISNHVVEMITSLGDWIYLLILGNLVICLVFRGVVGGRIFAMRGMLGPMQMTELGILLAEAVAAVWVAGYFLVAIRENVREVVYGLVGRV